MAKPQSPLLRPKSRGNRSRDERSSNTPGSTISDALMERDIERYLEAEREEGDQRVDPRQVQEMVETDTRMTDSDEEDEDGEDDGGDGDHDDSIYSHVPVVHPRFRYAGACNVRTVKDGELSVREVESTADSIVP